MKKKYRKQDNVIIISGLILAAAVVVLCIFGYRYLNTWFADAAKKNKNKSAVLSEEMQYELIHTASAAPVSHTPTPEPTQDPNGASYLVTVMPENQHDMVLTPTMDPNEYWAIHGTPTPYVPYGEVTAHMATAFEAEASKYDKVPVSYATASSVLYQEGYDNSAFMAFDGDSSTSWQDGVEGNGIGQSLRAVLGGTYHIAYITFRVGNWRDVERWELNPRPSVITVWIGGSGYEVSFTDNMTEFCLAFSREVTASEVSFSIDNVFAGNSQDSEDLCISEITFYGSV